MCNTCKKSNCNCGSNNHSNKRILATIADIRATIATLNAKINEALQEINYPTLQGATERGNTTDNYITFKSILSELNSEDLSKIYNSLTILQEDEVAKILFNTYLDKLLPTSIELSKDGINLNVEDILSLAVTKDQAIFGTTVSGLDAVAQNDYITLKQSTDFLNEGLNTKVDKVENKSLVDNDEISKLENLKTQSEIDNDIDVATSLATSSLIPITSTVLPRGSQVPSYITNKGKATLKGNAESITIYTNTGTTPSTIEVSIGYERDAFYDKSTDSWIGGLEQKLPSIDLADELGDSTKDGATQRLVTEVANTSYKGFMDTDLGNRFVKEIYLYGNTSAHSEYYLRIAYRNRPNPPGQNEWYIEIASKRTGPTTDRVCAKTWWNANPENETVLYLNQVYSSGVYAALVVDWTALPEGVQTNIYAKINPIALKRKFSPTISANDEYVYVSSSEGNDNNRGSESHPLKTISFARTTGKNIRLKRGDTFYENITDCPVGISDYGSGNLPIISGFKHIKADNNPWIEESSNIWKIDLSVLGNFTGRTAHSAANSNVGFIFNNVNKKIYGQKVRYENELDSNFKFWQTDKVAPFVDSDFQYIYMYCDTNPNTLNLSIATSGNGVRIIDGGSVEYCRITGFSRHGVSCQTRNQVRNNIIEYIGGQVHTISDWVRLGNGIEFYPTNVDAVDSLITDNIVKNIFDCGWTIQATLGATAKMRNIYTARNKFINCKQSFENWNRSMDGENYNYMEDCVCEYNHSINAGDNGFGIDEGVNAGVIGHILTNDSLFRSGTIYRNNVFIGGKCFLNHRELDEVYKSNVLEFNKIYIKVGDTLLKNRWGNVDIIVIPEDPQDQEVAIESYRELTGDLTSEIIIITQEQEEIISNMMV